MDCYANARKGESWGNIIGFSLLPLAHAGSTERARRQFGVAWPDLTELVSGGAGSTHASGRTTPAEIGQEENILNWFADVDAGCSFRVLGVYTPSTRTRLQTNCVCRTADSYD